MARPLPEVFDFFSDARNLERITPPWLGFQVLKTSTAGIQKGTLIDYQLRLHGIPLRWRSEIEQWLSHQMFVDRQVRGPYALWHHTHTFFPDRAGTWIVDEVHYRLPGGFLGRWIALPFVKKDLRKIFDYRREQVASLFP